MTRVLRYKHHYFAQTQFTQIPISKSPVPALAREREDVNKLVSDLIGGTLSPSPSHSPQTAKSKSPEPSPVSVGEHEGEEKITPTFTQKKSVKLVKDTLAPINIKPKV